jgi:hypothetical protein
MLLRIDLEDGRNQFLNLPTPQNRYPAEQREKGECDRLLFFNPSLDGGFPLLLLSRPKRRSNSAIRATRDGTSSLSCAFSARSTARSSADDTASSTAALAKKVGAVLIHTLTHASNQPVKRGREKFDLSSYGFSGQAWP